MLLYPFSQCKNIILNFNINVSVHEFMNIRVYWGLLLTSGCIAWMQLTNGKHLNTYWNDACLFLILPKCCEKKLLEKVHEIFSFFEESNSIKIVTGRSEKLPKSSLKSECRIYVLKWDQIQPSSRKYFLS